MRYELRQERAEILLQKIERIERERREALRKGRESRRAWKECPDCGRQRKLIGGAFYCGTNYERCYDDG